MKTTDTLRYRLAFGAALGALSLGNFAYAQEEATSDEPVTIIEESEEESRQERVVVTGSLLRNSEFASASPVQIITSEVAALEGLVDAGEILQGSSVAAGSTQLNNQFAGFVVDGGTGVQSVDLRGCGGTRTLTLINGKRPGPSGTRGAVGSFDFNNMPSSIVSSYEILKDSGSTIYGSDAVCGVVNIITRTSVDEPELNLSYTAPFESGGEQLQLSGAYGFDFDNGSISLAGEFFKGEDLSLGDRDYLSCEEDYVTDPLTGARLDRENRSITADGSGSACGNIYVNTYIDQVFGTRLIPSPDGRVIGTPAGFTIPGYRPRENSGFTATDVAFYEDVLEDPRYLTANAINEVERLALYGVADFDFKFLGGVNSKTEFLYNNRKTTAENWRQFFPQIRGVSTIFGNLFAYDQDPTFVSPTNSVGLPVILWPSNTEVDIDYFYAATSLTGDFADSGISFLEDWAWELGANYSLSEGAYTRNQIQASQTGDWSQFGPAGQYDAQGNPIGGTGPIPQFNYFQESWLSGNYTQAEFDTINELETGNTEYTQWLINGNMAGELFDLNAGPVLAAVGFEYRKFEINDVPGELTRAGDVWGSSTAGITAGEDTVAEVFTELEVPLLKGQPFAEELVLDLSARAFDYDSFGSDWVYKMGLNWQIHPSVRFRATNGTSYRAPALFELFLDNQTGFVGQTAIDPCINLQDSNNQRLIDNCTSLGIPLDYSGLGSSATVVSGGGAGVLEAETSETTTIGLIYTPSFSDLSIAVDYYEISIDDQISQLGAGAILSGCYDADNFPNAFCNLFTRNPATDPTEPFQILTVQDSYLNVNSQEFRGIDLEARYVKELNFGTLTLDGDMSWALERNLQLFAPGTVQGFNETDANGTIGFPSVTGNLLAKFDRGDWTYAWAIDYIGRMSDERFADTPGGIGEPYFGTLANVDYTTEATFYHAASVRWTGDEWGVTVGVRNLFDEHPPFISPEADFTRGQVPGFATQYDLRGRRAFVQIQKTF